MAQSPSRVPIGDSKFGPRVGEPVPNFSLRDQTGKTWTLRSIMGPKGTVIVFFALETGEVTYCKTQLIELQGRVKELRTNGLGLAAIGDDSPAILEAFRRQHAITRSRSYPTAGSATIKRYGSRASGSFSCSH